MHDRCAAEADRHLDHLTVENITADQGQVDTGYTTLIKRTPAEGTHEDSRAVQSGLSDGTGTW